MKSIYLIILINLVFIYSFYDLTEKDKERLPNPKDRQRFEKFLKKLQKIDDYINIEPRVLEVDTSESGESESGESESESGESESESGESESESGESESESGESQSESGESQSEPGETQPSGNKTEDEHVPVTAPARPPEPNRDAKVTLIGFNKFTKATTKNPSRKKGGDPNKQVYYIDFLIRLFFNIEVETPPRMVRMKLVVSSRNSRLRSLENEEVDADCKIDGDDKEKKGNSTIKYNCEAESETVPEEVGAKEELTFYEDEDGEVAMNDLEGNIYITPQAYVEATNLDKALNTSNFVTLNGEAVGKSTYFVISGSLEGEKKGVDELRAAKAIKFKFYDNSPNPTLKDGKRLLSDLTDREVKIECPVTNSDQNNYEITCTPTEAFQGNLHRASGEVGDTSLTLNLGQGKDGVDVDPNKSSPSPSPSSSSSSSSNEPQKNPTNYRKNSSGLSGGSIAGIVIACAAALIIATIVALVLKSPKAPVNNNSSIVGLKTDDFQG